MINNNLILIFFEVYLKKGKQFFPSYYLSTVIDNINIINVTLLLQYANTASILYYYSHNVVQGRTDGGGGCLNSTVILYCLW